MELNQLGCQRTVEEWQHVWDVWRGKVKTKARKVQDNIRGTGGGPAIPGLSDIDNRILEIVGPASVYGFADAEQGLPPEGPLDQEPPVDPAPAPPSMAPEPPQPVVVPDPALEVIVQDLPGVPPERPARQSQVSRRPQVPPINPVRGRGTQRRLHRPRPPRPPINDNLVQALRENDRLMRDTIQAVSTSVVRAIGELGAANIQAAQILAAALSSLGSVAVVQEEDTL